MKKVDPAHFARFKMPHSVKCRGNDVYFAVKTADIEANAYKNDLYVLKEGKVKRLTALGDMGSFTLTEAGILFAAARTKEEKERQEKGIPVTVFYLLPYDGGEALPAFTVNASVMDIYPAGESLSIQDFKQFIGRKNKALVHCSGRQVFFLCRGGEHDCVDSVGTGMPTNGAVLSIGRAGRLLRHGLFDQFKALSG